MYNITLVRALKNTIHFCQNKPLDKNRKVDNLSISIIFL